MKNKARHFKRHARFRATQRFGATNAELEALAQQIRDGKLVSVHRQSDARRHYNAVLNGKPVIVVWDKNRKEIVTVMEREVQCSEAS